MPKPELRLTRPRNSQRSPWGLMLPLLVVVQGVVSWPLVNTIGLSFSYAGLVVQTGGWVGAQSYIRALGSRAFPQAFLNTGWFTVVSVAAELAPGVTAALLLNRQVHGRTLMRALMILPWALPTVVNAILWRLIDNPDHGAAKALLLQLGVIDAYRSWLGQPGSAMAAMVVADVWKNFLLAARIGLAALQSVPREAIAAASVDGAGRVARFRFVLMPCLAGPLMIALVLRTIEAFKVFDIIGVMTRGSPASSTRTLSSLVYHEAFSFQRPGPGASMALIIALLAGVHVAVMRRAALRG